MTMMGWIAVALTAASVALWVRQALMPADERADEPAERARRWLVGLAAGVLPVAYLQWFGAYVEEGASVQPGAGVALLLLWLCHVAVIVLFFAWVSDSVAGWLMAGALAVLILAMTPVGAIAGAFGPLVVILPVVAFALQLWPRRWHARQPAPGERER